MYFIPNRSLNTHIHMYFYLLSRHCQQGSRFLQFVHEINGVESKAGLLWVKYISLYAVFVL